MANYLGEITTHRVSEVTSVTWCGEKVLQQVNLRRDLGPKNRSWFRNWFRLSSGY